MKIKVYNTKKAYRMTTQDDKTICVAYKYSHALKTFFHKAYNEKVSKIEGCALKPDLEKHPDAYEYTMLVPSTDAKAPLKELKDLLASSVFTDKLTFVNAESTKKAETKASAPKKSKKKPELVFKQIKSGNEKKEETKA